MEMENPLPPPEEAFDEASLADIVMALQTPGGGVERRLFCHGVILANASQVWRRQLVGWSSGAPRDAEGRKIIAVTLDDAAEVPSFVSMVRFCYTGKLDAPSVGHLLQVMLAAERMQVAPCLFRAIKDVCARALTPDEVAAVFATIPQTMLSGSCRELVHYCRKRVGALYGDLTATLNTPTLLDEFVKLPYEAIDGFFNADELVVTGEEDVLELMNAWHVANQDQATFVFSQALRFNQLSACMLVNVALKLPWLSRGATEHIHRRLVTAERAKMPPPRGGTKPPGYLTWRLPFGVLKDLFADAFSSVEARDENGRYNELTCDTVYRYRGMLLGLTVVVKGFFDEDDDDDDGDDVGTVDLIVTCTPSKEARALVGGGLLDVFPLHFHMSVSGVVEFQAPDGAWSSEACVGYGYDTHLLRENIFGGPITPAEGWEGVLRSKLLVDAAGYCHVRVRDLVIS